jgi:hypothetical protein
MSEHRFFTVFGPFSTVFRRRFVGGKGGFARLLPFSDARVPLKNGENGENGCRSNPCLFSGDSPI